MTEQEWLEARDKGITGTGASAIVGCNPYMSNVDYWEILTGRKPRPDVGNNALARYGQQAEVPLIELFRLDHPDLEVLHKDYDLRRHPDYDWLIGSIDGELVNKENGEHGLLEIKTSSILSMAQKTVWNNGIPDNYFYQVLHYLLVNPSFQFVVLKAQLKYQRQDDLMLTVRHYTFRRSEVAGLLEDLFEKEKTFIQCVREDRRPALILPRI